MFGSEVDTAALAHARAEWPREAVGYVIDGAYVRQRNIAADPVSTFRVADEAWSDEVEAVIHSHVAPAVPGSEPRAPSRADQVGQGASAVPWGICWTDGRGGALPPLWFGDHLLDEPLVGRPFVPGSLDCYELVRAWWWQTRGVRLPVVPRDAEWWAAGGDLLAQGFRGAGFVPVDPAEARPGDGLLIAVPATGVVNHCAVLIDGGLMLHHRGGQLSRREPWSGAWRRLTRMVVRHAD